MMCRIIILLSLCYLISMTYYLLYVRTDEDSFQMADFPSNSSIFDTCPLTLYNHLDAELLQFYHPTYNPKANCSVYEPLTKLVDGRVIVDRKAIGYDCIARCLLPKKDFSYIAKTWIKLPSEHLFECDIVETSCTKNGTTEAFLHSQIYEKKEKQIINRPDVYILVLDAVSSYMSKRSLPKTLEYLKSMGGIQIEFLNKVGDGSRGNGFPLLFGPSVLVILAKSICMPKNFDEQAIKQAKIISRVHRNLHNLSISDFTSTLENLTLLAMAIENNEHCHTL
ncbi:hypothetical protein DICVIV_13518 [Dictyocaulus viviparus]|uniref:Uncharacterized protein n=1 Tax=Dictyocaulus viviparus TaxID=29172 RepID=A0A0D8XA63_DICVI|nr:hypothetical protein DICVIV_13518 [Dictyocaulus viviparus]